MFNLLFSAIFLIASLLFPIVASHKALQANDMTLIRPWLMYWIVLAFALTIESMFEGILALLPFYELIRIGFLMWLVLPQTQGATYLYIEYAEPYLTEYSVDKVLDKAVVYGRSLMGTSTVSKVETTKQFEKAPVTSYLDGLLDRFRITNRQEFALSDVLSGWMRSAVTPEQAKEKRSQLLAMAFALESHEGQQDTSSHMLNEPRSSPSDAQKKGWFS